MAKFSCEKKKDTYFKYYIIFSMLLIINYFYRTNFSVIILVLTFLLGVLMNTRLGISYIILYIPHFEYIKTVPFTSFNLLIFFILTLFIAKVVQLFLSNKNFNLKIVIMMILFVFLNVIALLINLSNLELIASYYGMFFASLIFFLVITTIDSKDEITDILNVLVLSATVLSIILLVEITISSALFRGGRLTYLSSVRLLANTLAPAILVISNRVFLAKNRGDNRFLYPVMLIVYIFLLLYTGSRGTFYSLLIATVISYFYKTVKSRSILPLVSTTVFIGLIGFVIVYFGSIDTDFSKVINRVFEIDRNIRLDIWANAFTKMNLRDYVFGRGLNSFQEFSELGNITSKYGEAYYAHSVYIDVLVSSGLFSFMILILFFVSISVKAFKQKDTLTIGFCLFLLFSYSTHGQAIDIFYWALLATVYVSVNSNANKVKKEMVKVIDMEGYDAKDITCCCFTR